MPTVSLQTDLRQILVQYADSFSAKSYGEENDDYDVLMNVFGITPELKRENRQYWGRELGMCWQRLVDSVFRSRAANYAPGILTGRRERETMCDFCLGKKAIDTKYRIGSGDSRFQKEIKEYGPQLIAKGLEPYLLILRSDNLHAAIRAAERGNWKILTDDKTFAFIKHHTGFDLHGFLHRAARKHEIKRRAQTPQ